MVGNIKMSINRSKEKSVGVKRKSEGWGGLDREVDESRKMLEVLEEMSMKEKVEASR